MDEFKFQDLWNCHNSKEKIVCKTTDNANALLDYLKNYLTVRQ